MDHAGRNCVLIEYVSNTSMDKLNDFHFMQLIKINYWLFDDETHSGEFWMFINKCIDNKYDANKELIVFLIN